MVQRSILILTLVSLIVWVIPACGGGDSVAPGVRVNGTIQGHVFDVASVGPLAEVTVRITSTPFVTDNTGTSEIIVITFTDENGNFFRDDIPNGEIVVECGKVGYRTPPYQIWALSPGGGGDFRFEMAPGEDPVPEFEGDEQWAHPPEWWGKPGE